MLSFSARQWLGSKLALPVIWLVQVSHSMTAVSSRPCAPSTSKGVSSAWAAHSSHCPLLRSNKFCSVATIFPPKYEGALWSLSSNSVKPACFSDKPRSESGLSEAAGDLSPNCRADDFLYKGFYNPRRVIHAALVRASSIPGQARAGRAVAGSVTGPEGPAG